MKKVIVESSSEELEGRDCSATPDSETIIEVLCLTLYAVITLMVV